jgi:hypothetical protein
MKTFVFIALVLSLSAFASYTYTITDGMDFGDLSLVGSQSLLMTGGGGHYLNLLYYSTATINNTSPLTTEGNGGIWQILAGGYSNITIEGGAIHRLDLASDYAQAQISSGQIILLGSTQNATYTKHIEIICRDYNYNTTSKILNGTWADNSLFNIQLVNVSGYSPTIDNIKFTIVPEPASMLLLGLGGLFLRQRRK